MRLTLSLLLLLSFFSCSLVGDKDQPVPEVIPVDGRDSIIGIFYGQVHEWYTHQEFDSTKQTMVWITDDSLYSGSCEIAKRFKDSFTVIIQPAVASEFYEYKPGGRQYVSGTPHRGGSILNLQGDSVDYTQDMYLTGSSIGGGKIFKGKR